MTGSTSQVPPPWAVLLPKPWDPDKLIATVARLADASWRTRSTGRKRDAHSAMAPAGPPRRRAAEAFERATATPG
ncbi:MAG: hypothetical protein U0838_14165 [Chloroflexota bacterium]